MHRDSTARAAAPYDTHPQPAHDWIEPLAEERGLPRQELIFVSRSHLARDLDLASYQRDRGCHDRLAGGSPEPARDGVIAAEHHAG
ncbi:hypothetical protein G6F65_022170 [Rhizopus arrhizus]|nr:hypothetical protein G6F65_022170 [Rhizopus arrhizus]